MSPDSEYVILVTYTFTLGIDMCNFPNIWAVLSILLNTTDRQLQYVQNLQHIYNECCRTCSDDAMIQLEKQCFHIQNVMYGNYDKHAFDKVSDADDEIPPQLITAKQNIAQNANRDTNTTDKVDRIEMQRKDQLTNNTSISIQHGQQVISYITPICIHRVKI